MYGLSTNILEELDKTAFYSEDPDAFSNMGILNKIIRWKRKVFFSSGRPSFKTLVSESEWGVSQNLECMKYALELYSERRLGEYLKKKIQHDKDYKKEMKWQKEMYRHFWSLMTFGKGKNLYTFESEALFTDKGRFTPSFLKPRKHLGFFKKRIISCDEPVSVLGFINTGRTIDVLAERQESFVYQFAAFDKIARYAGYKGCYSLYKDYSKVNSEADDDEKDYFENINYAIGKIKIFLSLLYNPYNIVNDGTQITKEYVDSTLNLSLKWFSSYDAMPFYATKSMPAFKSLLKFDVPYHKLIETYKNMNKDLQAVMKKKNKKKSLFRLFVPKRTLNEELPVEDVKLHQISSYSLYDLKSRSSIKFWKVTTHLPKGR